MTLNDEISLADRPALAPFRVSALIIGVMMSLVLYGYQVGKSNHTVYLLDAYRHLDPELLTRDWFTNSTLQYHGLFSWLTRKCLAWGLFDPVFLGGYLLTVIAFHYYAYRIVRALGGSAGAYLLSIVLLHISAGGTGLGGFQFLQDAAFLPSNVSNVAMLAGIGMLMERRVWAGAVALGVAGVFHINHAVFAPVVMVGGLLGQRRLRWSDWRRVWGPLALVCVLAGTNVLPALLHLGAEKSGESLPLPEFVRIYARLRHPHHYFPMAWPLGLWAICLWTLAPAGVFLLLARKRLSADARHVAYWIGGLLMAATLVAFLFAGVWFVSERLIQMAVFRFSIYYIYLACAITGWGVVDSGVVTGAARRAALFALPGVLVVGLVAASLGVAGAMPAEFVRAHWGPLVATTVLAGLMAVYASFDSFRVRLVCGVVSLLPLMAWSTFCGLNYIPGDSPQYVRLAEWAKANTPKDAIFLVPPQEQSWRLDALRSVVINFKAIPQTAAEMPEWKRRMQDVTGVADLPSLAGTFSTTLAKLAEVYKNRPAEELVAVARKYGCRYIVASRALPGLTEVGPASGGAEGSGAVEFRLYDLDAGTPATRP